MVLRHATGEIGHAFDTGGKARIFGKYAEGGRKSLMAEIDRNTFDTLARLMRIMTYMFEDGDQPEDKEVLDDIALVRAWMAKIEKDVAPS